MLRKTYSDDMSGKDSCRVNGGHRDLFRWISGWTCDTVIPGGSGLRSHEKSGIESYKEFLCITKGTHVNIECTFKWKRT